MESRFLPLKLHHNLKMQSSLEQNVTSKFAWVVFTACMLSLSRCEQYLISHKKSMFSWSLLSPNELLYNLSSHTCCLIDISSRVWARLLWILCCEIKATQNAKRITAVTMVKHILVGRFFIARMKYHNITLIIAEKAENFECMKILPAW